MIILPDRNTPRSRILMAVPRKEWMPPSHAQYKTFCGDEDRTRFRLKAKTHDGRVVWVGWFDDRDDADAFLFALFSGSIRYERELWRLPTPEWHPGISTDLTYEFVTQTILTTTGSNQTYTSPSDWNNSNNQIECLGGGGSGALTGLADPATGGGAGAYSAITNFIFAVPGTTTATYRVGSGTSTNISSPSNGVSGTVTYFNASSDPGDGSDNSKCSAAPGAGGRNNQSSGGAGGASTASWGQTKYSGGRGGNMSSTGRSATGGGGSAGPNGLGGNGVDGSSGNTDGGTANNGTTAGGVAPGGAGVAGTEFSASYGCGSGGAGMATSGSGSAGSGGNYGSGGGGCASNNTPRSGGAGRQGLIVVEYTLPSARFSNMPMMGM